MRFGWAMTWPSLRVTLNLLPWCWSLWAWHDWPMSWSWRLDLGPVSLEFMANRPMFSKE